MVSETSIPEGWRWVRLGDMAEVVMGQSPPGELVTDWDGTVAHVKGLPFIQGNAEFGTKSPDPMKWCAQPSKVGVPGDVLISVRAPVGETNKVDKKLGIGRGLAAVRFNKSSRAFGWHVLNHTKEALDRVTQGSTFQAIGGSELRSLPILLPPPSEQRAIAAVLDTIDDSIERTEAVIEATEQLRDSLLHELLTRGVPGWHTAWKEVPGLGPIPADWDVVSLGEVSETITSGSRAWSRYFRPNGAFFVRSQNIVGGKIDHSDAIWVEPPLDSEAERTRIHEGDLLISITGEPGKATVADRNLGQAFVSQHVALVRLRDRRLSYFTGRFLQGRTGQDQFGRMAYGQTRPGLNLFNVSVIKIAVPTLQEQQVIAGLLDGVDVAIAEAKREWDGLGLLKESTADALLTGRVRVGKLMNEQDSMSDLSEATLWDARQVTAPGLMKSIAALNQPLFPPGLMKSIAALNQPLFPPGLMKSIAALNQPLFPPGLMKSIAALNQPLFPPGLMKSIAALNQPLFPPGLMKSIAALNQPLFPPGLMKSIAALNQPLFPPGLMKSIAALNQPLFPPGLMKSIAALNQPLFPPGLMKSIAALNLRAVTLPTAEYNEVLDVRALPNDLTDGNLALDRIVLGDDSEWLWLILYDYQITDPDLRRISRKLFADGHYAIAVERAYVYLNNLVKDKAGLGDEDGVALMNRTFSPKNPILKLSSLSSTSERDEQLGYMQILTGVMLGIRNPRVHEHEINDTPQEALEMLGLANHLARKVIGAMR